MKKRVKLFLLAILLIAGILRIYALDKIPISLYSDEVDVGYQAQSLLTTGRDYFGNFLPLHTKSYADTRAPLYLYSIIPTVALFGITPWGVRLPAAIFGVLGVLGMYLLVRQTVRFTRINKTIDLEKLALFAAFIMAISPWHIQYSRVAFDVTLLIFTLLFAFYFFFLGFKKHKAMYLSSLFFALSLWSYSTAKIFTPLIILTLFLLFKDKVIGISRKTLGVALFIFVVFSIPIAASTIKGEAGDRIGYISVFTDPTTKTEVDYARLSDAQVRGKGPFSIFSKIGTRIVHNKMTFWGEKIVNNYLSSLSFDFLFINGDPNLRHSINGMGQFYKIEAIFLILGAIALFSGLTDKKFKIFIVAWIMFAILPSSITRDGGNHATRLILLLPPLIYLIAIGLLQLTKIKNLNFKKILIFTVGVAYLFCIFKYMHYYTIHNPRYAERRWSYGYKEVAAFIKENESRYQKIIITNADEQPYVLFAAYYGIPPSQWQKGMQDVEFEGFGRLPSFEKYYFGQSAAGSQDDLWQYLGGDTLYVAASREFKGNLVMQPELTPYGLELLGYVVYPSGEPAFYFVTAKSDTVPGQ